MDRRFTSAFGFVMLLAFAGLTPITGAQGQGFEGVVTFQTPEGHNLRYYAGHSKVRMEMSAQGHDMTMLIDPATRVMDMVMPQQQMYMEMPLSHLNVDSIAESKHAKATKTGKTDVVAGHPCEYWKVQGENGETADVCLASDLGTFFAFRNPMQRGAAPAWEGLGGENRFPLKVLANKNGKVETVLEATSIEQKKLDPSLFSIPSSYHKMQMGMPMRNDH
jgi:hypothetical protein